jgi:glycosyltransferase involved in cell wall biosynthesis
MKICIVNTFDTHGGAARAAFRLYNGLRMMSGIDCSMYTLFKFSNDLGVRSIKLSGIEERKAKMNDAEINKEYEIYSGITSRGFAPFYGERSPYADYFFRDLPKADIINLHWVRGFVDYENFFSAISPAQKVVWTLHDMQPFTGGCHYAGDCRGYAHVCGRCPVLGSQDINDASSAILKRKHRIFSALEQTTLHIVSPSEWLAEQAKRSLAMYKFPVSVIPNSIDVEKFKPHDRSRVRAQLKLGANEKLIVFVAHVITDPRKQFFLLDDALYKIGARNDVTVLLVGQGTPRFRSKANFLRVGHISDDQTLSKIYAAANLVVVPSLEDNLPNTCLEAMSSGVPVLGFEIGGMPDLICHQYDGFLANPKEPNSLKENLEIALGDIAMLDSMGSRARKKIEKNYTMNRQASRYISLFHSIMK